MKKDCKLAPKCDCKCEKCKFKLHCIKHENKCHFACGKRDWSGTVREKNG